MEMLQSSKNTLIALDPIAKNTQPQLFENETNETSMQNP